VPAPVSPVLFALLAAAAPTPDAGADCPGCESFKSPRAAFEKVLETNPLALAIGEYHEVQGAPKVKSAIGRFTSDLLPLLKGKAGAMIAETWMLNGKCGETEKQAAKEVQKTTKRPKETEDEVTTMLGRSYALGLKNHILILTCDDYRSMLDEKGELDGEKSLLLVKRKVEEKALEVQEKEEAAIEGKGMLVLYGGALHNDLEPTERWAPYSFGPALDRELEHRYVELDLLVPEYVTDDEDLLKEPWFKAAMARAKRGETVLVSPKPGIRYLLFPTSKKPRSP
jgi:hypothetical protein